DDDELLFKRARVYFNMFRYKEALTDIDAAIAIKQDKAEYFLLLSQINFASGNYFEAIKASEKAENIGMENPELPILQAKVYWETGDTTRSKLYLHKVEQMIPFHSDISLLKGKLAAFKHDTLNAITYFLASIKSDRKNLAAYNDLIKLYLNKAKDDSALYFTLQAKKIAPFNADLYYAEARIYQKKELKQSALLSYLDCLRQDSLYAPALYQLGQIYFREGNPNEAFNYYKRYTALNKDSKEVYLNLITILNGLNRPEATIPYYERLIQLDSMNIGLKYVLQNLYKQYSMVAPDNSNSTVVMQADTVRRQRSVIARKDSSGVVRDTTK
ncbi:MAG TPA: tetratricopeptide repeat protein, partial [Cytophagaceae bacterium]|nr:tetratricopeptide repeat protein [Cytophagaceae bacterium]